MADPLDLYEAKPAFDLKGYVPIVEKPGEIGVALRSFGRQVLPMAAGVGAAPVGEIVGGAIGSLIALGPGTAIGAGIGGLLFGGAAGYGADRGQRAVSAGYLNNFGFQSEQDDVDAHPTTAFLGGVAAQAPFMRMGGGMSWRGAVGGAAIGAGVEAGTELAQGDFEPTKVAVQGAAGALLQHTTRLGQIVQRPANGIISGAARFGARATLEEGLRDVPGAAEQVRRAVAELQDPNITQATRLDLAKARVLHAALGERLMPSEIAARHVVENDALTEAANPYVASPDGDAAHAHALTTAADQLAADQPVDVPDPRALVASWQPNEIAAKSWHWAIQQQESGGNHLAVSPKGARGSMQVMPATAAKPGYGVAPAHDNSWQEWQRVGDELLDAYGQHYDSQLLATAAYNAGPGRVDQWLKTIGDPRTGDISPAEWAARIPIKETRDYVRKVYQRAGHGIPEAPELKRQFFTQIGAHDEPLVPGFDDPALFEQVEGDPFAAAEQADRSQSDIETPPAMLATGDYLDRYAEAVRPKDLLSPVDGMGSHLIAPDGRIHTLDLSQPGHSGDAGHDDFGRSVDPHDAAGFAAITSSGSEYALRRAANPTAAQDRTITELTARAKRNGQSITEGGLTGNVGVAYPTPAEPRAAPVRTRDTRPMSMRRKEPVDVLTFLADRGGLRDDEGHALGRYGRKVVGSGAYRSGRDLNRFIPGAGPLLRKSGMSIDRAGELLHEAGYFPGEDRPDTGEVLDLLERASREKIYTPEDADALERAGLPGGRAAPERLDRYSEPGGDGPIEQTDSLDHDIRMALDADPALSVQLDGAGDVVKVSDLLKSLDDADTAIAVLKTCAAPGATA